MHHFIQLRFSRTIVFFFLVLTIISLVSSCKREEARPSWDSEVITPLLKSSLTINDLLNDTSITANADSTLKLVYQNHLYDVALDSLFAIPDTGVRKVYNIDSISLLNQHISYPVTLGYMAQSAGLTGLIIISQQGNSAAIPAITFPASPDFTINADSLFQTITLITGAIDISITNGFPIPVNNIVFYLKDSISGVTLAQDTFPLIAVGATAIKTVLLDGKTINSKLTAKILSMNTPGSGGSPVLIDTANALVADLRIYNLHPSFATAIFPTQNLIDKAQAFKFNLAPVQLKEAVVNGGAIVLDLYSTLQDSVHFTYRLPSATLNGVPFIINHTLPPAPPGGVSNYYNSYSFAGYHLDMRGDVANGQDTVNTMYNVFQARVDSTGQMKTLSLQDSLFADISFQGLRPSYARGYLGKDTVLFGPASLAIDLFINITADKFELQNIKMSIDVENSLGADGEVYLKNLQSFGTHVTSNQTVQPITLTGSAINNPISIPRAIDPGGYPAPVTSSITNYVLDGSNSNAPAFISNLPDRIDYSLELHTNPNGNVLNYNDFVYTDKLMKFDLNLEIPLSFLADNLTLVDTVNISINPVDLSTIESGTLTLLADNGFPFDATVQMYMLNDAGAITEALFSHNVIAAAPVNASGRVTAPKRSKLLIPLTQDRINRFFYTHKVKVVAHFTTKPVGQNVKIYSDYKLDLKLTGDFNYHTN